MKQNKTVYNVKRSNNKQNKLLEKNNSNKFIGRFFLKLNQKILQFILQKMKMLHQKLAKMLEVMMVDK